MKPDEGAMKGLRSFLSWVVVIIIAAAIVIFIGWSRVPDIIASKLSERLKVPVTIDDISLTFNLIEVDNLKIANVPGGILKTAFSTEQILVKAPITHYFNETIVIDEIDLNNVYLGLEFESSKGTNGNWTELMGNLNSTTQAHEKEAESSGEKRVVTINTLILNNIQVDVVYVKDRTPVRKLPIIKQIVLKNISSDKGVPMDQIMNSVLGQMLQSVFIQQNLQNMLDNLLNQPQQSVERLLHPFRALFNTHFEKKEEEFESA